MFIHVIIFIVGIFILIKGADFLVNGASVFARWIGIPEIIIGLTIVSFGTSAPEFIVSLQSALNGSPEIALGNIIGSNIANILLILGIAGLIYHIPVEKGTVRTELPLSLIAALATFIIASDTILDKTSVVNSISRGEGLLLLLFFCIFLGYTFTVAIASRNEAGERPTKKQILIALGMIPLGLVALSFGGDMVVGSASIIAKSWGMSDRIIGLTIVAIGTSLPELATSIVAAMRRNTGILIGNIIGSNIFNVFFILGSVAVISPFTIQTNPLLDIFVMIGATIILLVSLLMSKKYVLERWQSAIFILLYVAYLIILLI